MSLRPLWTILGVARPRTWCSFLPNLLASNWLVYTIHFGIVYMLPCMNFNSILFNDYNYGPALGVSTPLCSLDPCEQYLGSCVPVPGAFFYQIHLQAIGCYILFIGVYLICCYAWTSIQSYSMTIIMGLHSFSQHQRVPLTLVNNTWGHVSPYLVLFSGKFTGKQLASTFYSKW